MGFNSWNSPHQAMGVTEKDLMQGCSPGWSHTSQDSGQIRARLMSAKRPVYSGAPQNPGANQ